MPAGLVVEAGNRGIAIYTLHLKTASGKANHTVPRGAPVPILPL